MDVVEAMGQPAEHIKNLEFNCQGGEAQPGGDIEGCIGWQNRYAEEEFGADTFIVNLEGRFTFHRHHQGSRDEWAAHAFVDRLP